MAATLKVDTITNASNAGTANLTLDASGNATVGGMVVPASSFKRNKLINGSMNVYQRGSVAATTSGAYTLDRWFVTPTGATVTVTQSTSTVPTNFTASLNVAGAASVTNVSVFQRIEDINCQDLVSGSKLTISGYVYQSSGSSVTSAGIGLVTPTIANNYAATTIPASGYTIPNIPSATWTYFSNTFTLTTGCTNGLQLTIALGTGLTTGSFNLTGLQLEVGSIATPYERQIYSNQLAECQRYYSIFGGEVTNDIIFGGYNAAASGTYTTLTLPVKMRTAPTSTKIGTWAATNCSQLSITATSSTTVAVATTVTALGAFLLQSQGTSTYITNSAEL